MEKPNLLDFVVLLIVTLAFLLMIQVAVVSMQAQSQIAEATSAITEYCSEA